MRILSCGLYKLFPVWLLIFLKGGLIAKVTSRGQITIPVDIRQKRNLKDGDKVAFIENGEEIIFANAAKAAFLNMQKAFEGEAERLGLKNEQDVVDMVKEIRKEMWEKHYADNDWYEYPCFRFFSNAKINRYYNWTPCYCIVVEANSEEAKRAWFETAFARGMAR